MIKFCFTSMSYGILTKLDTVITRWATKNGHVRVDSYEEADMIFDDEKLGGYPPTSDINNKSLFKIKKTKNAWLYLHSGEEVSEDGLIDLFQQACSTNTEVSRLGLDLIYRLRGDKYIDVHNIVEICRFQEAKHVNSFEIYRSIVNNYPLIDEKNLPLSILRYIESKNIYCKKTALPLFNWILNEYPLTNGSTKVEIKLS